MTIRKLLVGLAAGIALAATAYAGPIQHPVINLDPLGMGPVFPTDSNGQQVCPVGAIGCLTGSPFTQPSPNEFTINLLNNALFSASITASITPGTSGSFTVLSFALVNAANVVVGTGMLGTPLQDLALAAGTYTMRVLYTYTGLTDNSSASWAMTMTTAPRYDVPEPATLALLGLALTGLAFVRRRT